MHAYIHTFPATYIYHVVIFNALAELLCQVALLVTNPINNKEFPCSDSGHFWVQKLPN